MKHTKYEDEPERCGRNLYQIICDLFPLCRSITGEGTRLTLKYISDHIPIEIHEVPSGTKVFDWTIPLEWNINDAFIKCSDGMKIVDFKNTNLHILNYSTPVNRKMLLNELKEHLYSIPEMPQLIPYRTTYYQKNWGFCLAHNTLSALTDGEYEVFIDSSLEYGHLTYGEYYVKGIKEDEVMISCHICHPSLANDNLAGLSLAISLAKHISLTQQEYSYRFLFIPGTIGAITWLALNPGTINHVKHGLVLAGGGDNGPITYKKSRRGDAEIDKLMEHILTHTCKDYHLEEFSPYGYDERQYCSPGLNLPVGRLSRTPYGEYPEYHTSADNLEFVSPESLAATYFVLISLHRILEDNKTYQNTNPHCEPQLGRRGLYNSVGGEGNPNEVQLAMLWVLNMSDGDHSLLDIAERSGLYFQYIKEAADLLNIAGLLKIVDEV